MGKTIHQRSVFRTKRRKNMRDRQCYGCMEKIKKGEMYVNHQFRYDKTIITASFHIDCYGGD